MGELPFDSHTCSLSFWIPGTMNSGKFGIALKWAGIGSGRLSTGAWRITRGENFKTEVTSKTTSSMTSTYTSSLLKATFMLARNPGSYQVEVTLPTVLVYVVSWIGLWVDVTAVPGRVFAAFGPVVMVCSQITAVSDALP